MGKPKEGPAELRWWTFRQEGLQLVCLGWESTGAKGRLGSREEGDSKGEGVELGLSRRGEQASR